MNIQVTFNTDEELLEEYEIMLCESKVKPINDTGKMLLQFIRAEILRRMESMS